MALKMKMVVEKTREGERKMEKGMKMKMVEESKK